MDSHAGFAADLQGLPSRSAAANKISFSFGTKSCVRGSRTSVPSASSSSTSSTASLGFGSFTLSSRGGKPSTAAAVPPSAAAAPSKQVPSIFCSSSSSHEDDGCGSGERTAHQVLSFDKFSGWEEHGDIKKEKPPLVIPCLHPLRRAPSDHKAQKTLVRVSPASEIAENGFAAGSAGTAATDAGIRGTGGQGGGASGGGRASTVGWREATAIAAETASPARGREVEAVAEESKEAASEEHPTEGGTCRTARAEQSQTEEENSGVSVVLTTGSGALDGLRTAPAREQKDTDVSKQESDRQIPLQQSQEEKKKAVVQFGLIKREAATKPGKPCRSPSTPSCTASAVTSETDSHSHRATNAFAAAGAGATDSDELAAQALIAEARGGNAAAAAVAWDRKEDAGEAVPILARNAELAALRRKFRQRMQPQQQQQSEQAQQQVEEGHHEQQVQRKRVRGRGVFLWDKANLLSERGDFYSRSRGDTHRPGCFLLDRRNPVNTVFSNRSDAGSLRQVAAVYTGNSAVDTAAFVAAAAAGSVDDRESNKSVVLCKSHEGSKSQKQPPTALSREEAEKELLRQELELLPDAPNAYSTAYAAVPVDEFGLAMLRGMGYDPATATQSAAAEEGKNVKKRTYARAGLGSEVEMEKLWAEHEKKLKEEAMKEKKKKLEELQNSRYRR